MRPPIRKDDEPTKMFIVKPGHMIADFDGVMRIGKGTFPNKTDKPDGDLIELTYEQAKYYQALGKIYVPLEDFSNANSDDPANTDEAGAGSEVEPAGEPAVGTPRKNPLA